MKRLKKRNCPVDPSIDQLRAELQRVRYKKRYYYTVRSTVSVLIVVAAISVLISFLFLPVLQIHGQSMSPTLREGDIVLCVKDTDFESGDIVAFYIGNKLLVKRFIADAGQWVNIDDDGNVSVNGKVLDEPYLNQKAYGNCNIALPYQVPEKRIFCLGDQRSTSLDSRNTSVGCIADEQTVGKIIFRIWPISGFGPVE